MSDKDYNIVMTDINPYYLYQAYQADTPYRNHWIKQGCPKTPFTVEQMPTKCAKPLTVISLFDGISTGRYILEKCGFKINKYYCAEIDKNPCAISKYHYPDNIQLGDVNKWQDWNIDWSNVDLLIGGSPCQGFSSIGTGLNFNHPESVLFFKYIEIMEHLKKHNPRIKILLENVSMKVEWEQIISRYMQLNPVSLDSLHFSAQSRKRVYWFNWHIDGPMTASTAIIRDILDYTQPVFYSKRQDFYKSTPKSKFISLYEINSIGTVRDVKSDGYRVNSQFGKSRCILFQEKNYVLVYNPNRTCCIRKFTPLECERLQGLLDNYTKYGRDESGNIITLSDWARKSHIGNGWNVQTLCHIFNQMEAII